MFLHRARTKKEIEKLAELVMENDDFDSILEAIEDIKEHIQDNYYYLIAYQSITDIPLGYLLITGITVDQIFVRKKLQKKGYGTKIIEKLVLSKNFKRCFIWHYGRQNTIRLVNRLEKTQQKFIFNIKYTKYIMDILRFQETGTGTMIYRQNKKEALTRLIDYLKHNKDLTYIKRQIGAKIIH
jgi:hypothetical protein